MKTEPLILLRLLLHSFALGASLTFGNHLLCFLNAVFTHISRDSFPKKQRFRAILQGFQDFLICLVAGFFITVILFYYNDGRLRGFSILAMLFGALAYRHSLGKLFGRFCETWAKAIGHGIYFVFQSVTRPLLLVCAWSIRTATKPIVICRRKLLERRIQKYDAIRIEQLRKKSKEGFVTISWKRSDILMRLK